MMRKKTARDYKFIRLLGEGSYSSVYLAVEADVTSSQINPLDTSQNESGIGSESDSNETSSLIKVRPKIRKYAIKVCQKSHIKRQGKQVAIMREKEIMNILNQHPNPHFIKLHCTFQDTNRLFFVMTYAENGELLAHMQAHPLSIETVKRYSLEIVSALEHLHKFNIVHRDLKPENILLNDKMRLQITDFGSAQIYSDQTGDSTQSPARRNSFVGTAQYVSPEMLKSRQATNKSDLWALGVIIYQMVTNIMPFNAPNEYLIYQKIQNLDYEFTEGFDPVARNLVSSLIKKEPFDRLGAKDDVHKEGYRSLRNHEFLLSAQALTSEMSSIKSRDLNSQDPDLINIDQINPGLDEASLRLL